MKHSNIKVKGSLKSCDACKMGKASAMNMKKKTDTRSEIPGERIYIDLTRLQCIFGRIKVLDAGSV